MSNFMDQCSTFVKYRVAVRATPNRAIQHGDYVIFYTNTPGGEPRIAQCAVPTSVVGENVEIIIAIQPLSIFECSCCCAVVVKRRIVLVISNVNQIKLDGGIKAIAQETSEILIQYCHLILDLLRT